MNTKRPKQRTRRQHVVPAFYLAGFTATSSQDGCLHVYDIERKKPWESTPRRTAHCHDFYAVHGIPNENDNAVENRLAIMEGKWAEAIRQIVAAESLISDDVFSDLMTFVAFTMVRIPHFRRTLADFIDRAERKQVAATIATPAGWEHFRATAVQAIESTGRKPTREETMALADPEQFRNMLARGELNVDYDQTWHVQTMIESALSLLPFLGERHWSLRIAADGAPDFITSDSPVCLSWANESSGASPPGFALRGTLVTLPLNRRIGAVGSFEPLPDRCHIGDPGVGAMNKLTRQYATQVYSAAPVNA